MSETGFRGVVVDETPRPLPRPRVRGVTARGVPLVPRGVPRGVPPLKIRGAGELLGVPLGVPLVTIALGVPLGVPRGVTLPRPRMSPLGLPRTPRAAPRSPPKLPRAPRFANGRADK